MYNPLVSIILPVYNGERFLKQALDSIISQSYVNFELIIVDDNSQDNTPKIILEYKEKDNRIKTLKHDRNEYLPQALNTGFNIAKGELFTWTSDDNIYNENAIGHLVDVLSDISIDIVYGNQIDIDENGRKNFVYEIESPENIPILSCIGGYFMFRRNIYYDIGGYDTKWFLVEDWAFWLKAYNSGFKFIKTEKDYYYYRQSKTSLTSTRRMDINTIAIKLSLRNLRLNKLKYDDKIAMRAYLKNIRRCEIVGDKDLGKECLLMAKQINIDAKKYLNRELCFWLGEES